MGERESAKRSEVEMAVSGWLVAVVRSGREATPRIETLQPEHGHAGGGKGEREGKRREEIQVCQPERGSRLAEQNESRRGDADAPKMLVGQTRLPPVPCLSLSLSSGHNGAVFKAPG